MRPLVKTLLLPLFLASCGTAEETRYRSTDDLERPPIVANNSPTREERAVDNSSIPRKKDSTGLGTDVYQNSPLQLTIKQPFDQAWNTLNRAFKQGGIKITDHERDKGLYYVTRDLTDPTESTGFLAKMGSFFSNDAAVYLLTVKQEGEETTVASAIANATEQSSAAKKGNPTPEGAEELLQLLFKTLRDKLEEE